MIEWCIAHPWLTFMCVIIKLVCLEGIVANICKAALLSQAMKHKLDEDSESTEVEE